MTRLAAAVDWTGRPLPGELGAAMLAPVRRGGRERATWRTAEAVAMGAVRDLRRGDGPTAGAWLADGSLAIVADARLDDRAALRRRLERAVPLPAEAGDGLLLLAAYRCWGDDLVERVRGDFAFVLWDAERRRLLAARDAFGLRPLVYRAEPGRLLLASEPKQILGLPGVPVEPDELVLGEYLLGRFEEVERTFFSGLRRLPPGHSLVARAGRVEARRWWLPDPARLAGRHRPGEGLARFRQALGRAVARRLEPGVPVLAHLSGGLDSASLVAVAAATADGHRPRIETVSCRFPRLACDEAPFIRAFVERSPFRHHEVFPAERSPLDRLDEELWRLDSPFADLQRGQFEAVAELAAALGAGVLMTGIGGDEVTHEEYYLRDLAARRRLPRLLAECWRGSRYSHNSFAALLKDALAPTLPPAVRRAYRRLRRPRGWRPPVWAAPGFVERFLHGPAPPAPPAAGFPSETQESVLRYVNYPDLAWCLEAFDARAAAAGLTAMHPFFDRDLVECVLAIPFEERFAGGRWKRLLRDGLYDELPPALRERRRKTTFDSFERYLMARWGRQLEAMLFAGGSWHAARFVEPVAARALVRRAAAPGAGWSEVRQAWRVATAELWLARLDRYNSRAPTFDLATKPAVARSPDAPREGGEEPARRHEAILPAEA